MSSHTSSIRSADIISTHRIGPASVIVTYRTYQDDDPMILKIRERMCLRECQYNIGVRLTFIKLSKVRTITHPLYRYDTNNKVSHLINIFNRSTRLLAIKWIASYQDRVMNLDDKVSDYINSSRSIIDLRQEGLS